MFIKAWIRAATEAWYWPCRRGGGRGGWVSEACTSGTCCRARGRQLWTGSRPASGPAPTPYLQRQEGTQNSLLDRKFSQLSDCYWPSHYHIIAASSASLLLMYIQHCHFPFLSVFMLSQLPRLLSLTYQTIFADTRCKHRRVGLFETSSLISFDFKSLCIKGLIFRALS